MNDVEHLSDAFRTDAMKELFIAAIERREKCRDECDLFNYCNGGCSMDALSERGMNNNGGTSCRIFKKLFIHIRNVINDIVDSRRDLSKYNKFIREAVIGKLVNPNIAGI